MLDNVVYNGFEIQAVPQQLADSSEWQINLNISRHSKGQINTRNFSAIDRYKSREEAQNHCIQLEKKIIDGAIVDASVVDL